MTVASGRTPAATSSKASAPVGVNMTTGAPGTPTGVTAVSVSDSAIGVTWAPGTGGRRPRRRLPRFSATASCSPRPRGPRTSRATSPRAAPYTFTVQAVDARSRLSAMSVPGASATTAPPVPTTGNAHAYLLATTDRSLRRPPGPLPRHRRRAPDVLRVQPDDLGHPGPRRPARHPVGPGPQGEGPRPLRLPERRGDRRPSSTTRRPAQNTLERPRRPSSAATATTASASTSRPAPRANRAALTSFVADLGRAPARDWPAC